MTKRRTWFEILLIFFIVAVVAVVVGYTAISTKWNGRAQDELAKIRAKGEPITCAELAPPPVPDQINAALIYQQAFTMLPVSSSGNDSQIIDTVITKEERIKDPSLWDKSRQILVRNRQLMDTIAEAARRPKCRFPVKWEDGAAALLPHYSKIREIARWEAADALVKAKYGDMAGSILASEIGLSVSESIKDEPILISLLVRASMVNITLTSLHDSLELGKINDSQAWQLDAALARIRLDEAFVKAMIGERAQGLWVFDSLRKNGPVTMEALTGGDSQQIMQNIPMYLVSRRIGQPIFNADKTCYLRYMGKQIELARKPYYKVAADIADFDPATDAPAYAPITKIFCPVFSRARLGSERGMANIAVTRAGLGVVTYKNKFGTYPQTLSELNAKLGWTLPKDPFSGKDLKYKKTANGFVIYSIGSNMVDEGGKVPDKKSNDQDAGDVVWKFGN